MCSEARLPAPSHLPSLVRGLLSAVFQSEEASVRMSFVSLPQWPMCRDRMESACFPPRRAEAFGHLGRSPAAGSAWEPVV
jgi:hypothetical protein